MLVVPAMISSSGQIIYRVGRLSEIIRVGRMEPVPEHVSSVPGPDGDAEAISAQA